MRGVQRFAIWFGLVVGILAGLMVAVNVIDEPLKPELHALLESKIEVSPEAVEGFKYSLGLRAPAGQDPKEVGEELYRRLQASGQETESSDSSSAPREAISVEGSENPCKDKLYCYRAVFEKDGPAVAAFLKRNEIPLQRFNQLIALKEMASDMRPNMANLASQEAALLEFSKVKYVDLSARLHERRVEEVAGDVKAISLFIKNSLRYQQTMLDTAVLVEVFRANREFFTVASRGYPELRAALGEGGLDVFKLDLDFETLVARATAVEFKAILSVIEGPIASGSVELAKLSEGSSGVVKATAWRQHKLLQPLKAAFLKPNETMNSLYAAYTESRSATCSGLNGECGKHPLALGLSYLINPYGKSYIEVFRPRSAYFRMLKEKLAGLNSPVES